MDAYRTLLTKCLNSVILCNNSMTLVSFYADDEFSDMLKHYKWLHNLATYSEINLNQHD